MLYAQKKFASVRERIGHLRQFCGIDKLVIADGSGQGNHILQIRNGSGLRFEINASRGFDIGLCELFSIPISWMSPCGTHSPSSYQSAGNGWELGFEGGMLVTCGLTQAGQANVDQNIPLGIHGRISYLPSELLQSELVQTEMEHPYFLVKARTSEAVLGEGSLCITRTIKAYLFKNTIEIHDEIVNNGFTTMPHMILYHINFGFPLITETVKIDTPSGEAEVIKGDADLLSAMQMPPVSTAALPDVVLYKSQHKAEQVRLQLSNNIEFNGGHADLTATLGYNTSQCPYLTRWRHPAKGMNVLALEPGNVSTKGRAYHREQGLLTLLEPGEMREYDISLSFSLNP